MAFVPVPAAALDALPPTDWHAVLDLYQRAWRLRWKPYAVTERSLASRWGCGNRRVRRILAALAAAGLLSLAASADGTTVSVACPVQREARQATPTPPKPAAPEAPVQRTVQRETPPPPPPIREAAAPVAAPLTRAPDPDLSAEGSEETQVPIAFPLRLLGRAPSRLPEGIAAALRAVGICGGRAVAERSRDELLAVPGIGVARVDTIERWLADHGLALRTPANPDRHLEACRAAWDRGWGSGRRYPWELADRERTRRWAEALDLDRDPVDGAVRLERGIRAYVAAAAAGTAWPIGDPPTTRAFSADVAKWVLIGEQLAAAPPARRVAVIDRSAPSRPLRGGR